MSLPDPPLLVITDRRMADRPLADVVEAALSGGCRWILLREPDLDTAALTRIGRDIAALCARHGARLSVSADLDAAAACGATGLHLPQRSAHSEGVAAARDRLGRQALIGISAHSAEEISAAEELGADYVTMSPVFLTESKPGYGPALGVDGLRAHVGSHAIPIVGLGGLSQDRIAPVRRSGAAGAAVMGDVMRASAPAAAVRRLLTAWRDADP